MEDLGIIEINEEDSEFLDGNGINDISSNNSVPIVYKEHKILNKEDINNLEDINIEEDLIQ